MDLPRGNTIVTDCPIVRQYKSKRGPTVSVQRPTPDKSITGISYDPNVSLDRLEKYYILKALEYFNGNLSRAAKSLGIGKATIYKKMREWK